jgi:hypothetical protein
LVLRYFLYKHCSVLRNHTPFLTEKPDSQGSDKPENSEPSSSQDSQGSQASTQPELCCPAKSLTRLVSLAGHCALRQLIHLDVAVFGELKRRHQIQEEQEIAKKKKSTTAAPRNKVNMGICKKKLGILLQKLFSGVRPSGGWGICLSIKQARFVTMGAIDMLLCEEIPLGHVTWQNQKSAPYLKTIRAKVVRFCIKPKLMKCRFEVTHFYDLLTYIKTVRGMPTSRKEDS